MYTISRLDTIYNFNTKNVCLCIKMYRICRFLSEPRIRPHFCLFSQYVNTEESLNTKGWTVLLYVYAPKCMKFCHIIYRPEIAKNFHRWNPWDSGVSAVLHIFPNEKTELNHTAKYFLSEYVKKVGTGFA